jgi:diadenosine tetraphosphate (Ap4A) HIT family hydrolase
MSKIDLDEFHLDPRIAADSDEICDLTLCQARLHHDARYPWLLLIPRRAGVSELFDLAPADRAVLAEEAAAAGQVLKDVTRCDKINIGSLGNVVSQLHVHVTARFQDDPAWPRAAWGYGQPHQYDQAARDALLQVLRNRLRSA